ncbi:polysaccharide deacetylase family protein [Trebonia sp.]|uniref:polysaccharide deacetylase family protein n=1 Tax=Trebonia sp. TaxID=2767075 RepID=UPI0026324DB1|nr:polysaccharide deacetylase family protein [Trebonia sp.]
MTAGNGTGLGRLGLGSVPLILMYHAVDTADHDPHMLSVRPDRFAAQMGWLRRRGLRGVAVGTLVAAMHASRARGLVGITFDDGYASVLANAVPELLRREFTATVFVIAGRVGQVNDWDRGTPWPLLSRSQIGELAAAGIEIGSHSATHQPLAGADPELLEAEVRGSRDSLSRLADAEIRGFAYPYGSMDAAARRAVRAAGYEYGCAVRTPWAQLGLMALPRVYMGQRDDPARMAAKRLLYRADIAVRGGRS